MEMFDFYIILGMNWLENHQAKVDLQSKLNLHNREASR